MATLHKLRPQIDQGKTAVLFFKVDAENIEASIRKNAQGQYTHTLSRPDLPNPFPRPQAETYSSWEYVLADLEDLQATSDQWSIK